LKELKLKELKLKELKLKELKLEESESLLKLEYSESLLKELLKFASEGAILQEVTVAVSSYSGP
jgi:hypothetical protein